MSPGLTDEAGQTARTVVEAMKAQPGLLYLSIVNLAFLVFVYFVGTLVLSAFDEIMRQTHERYTHTIELVDRCFIERIGGNLDTGPSQRYSPSPREMHGP